MKMKLEGTKAELHETLVKLGFSYVAGDKTDEMVYRNKNNSAPVKQLVVFKIASGAPAFATGNKVGLVRTAQMPDTWSVEI